MLEGGLYRNHLGIFNPLEYDQYGISIIGCGSIGSVTALTLAKMGFTKQFLYDDDTIEAHNIATQLFRSDSIGNQKVESLRNMLCCYSECERESVKKYPIKYTKEIPLLSEVVIVCTDNMESRLEVLKGCKKWGVKLLIDARMGGEVFSVFTVDMTKVRTVKAYEKTFHPTREGNCTQKGILYNINMITSIICSQLVRVMKNEKYSWEINGSSKTLDIWK